MVLGFLKRRPFSVVGHRGARGLAPENTLVALRAAISAGADAAEFDVQRTADGVLVASHDPVVVGDDGRRVDVRRSSYSEIASVTVKGERLPRLEEIIAEAGGRIGLLFDVKEASDTGSLVELLRREAAVEQSAVISFDDRAIIEARRLEPRLATGLIYFRPPGRILDCKRLGCRLVLPRYPLATEKAVALAHRLGMLVLAWTVNSEEWALRLARRRVDAIATDYPDRLARLRNSLAGGAGL